MNKLVPLLVMALAGCVAPPRPHTIMLAHPTTDATTYHRDLAQCRYEVMAATAGYGMGPTANTMGGAIAQGLMEGLETSQRRRELTLLCMKARGYIHVNAI